MTSTAEGCRRRHLLRLVAAGGVGALLAELAGCHAKTPAKLVPPGSVVLALGDSLTYGTGATPDTAYPAVLAGLTGWQVVNAGVPGDTSAQALARLPALLAEHRPKLVIVSLGGNDFLRRLPEADTRTHLHAIGRQALDAGAQVLLVAVPRLSAGAALGQPTDHPLYAQVASDLQIPLQRQGWGEVLADAELRSDPVHANARGYAQFARSLRGTALAVGLLPNP